MQEDTETSFEASPELDNAMDELRKFMLENNITPEALRDDLNDQENGLLTRVHERRQSKREKRLERINEAEEEAEERLLEEGHEILSPYIVDAGSRQRVFEALSGSGVNLEDKKQLIEWIEKECNLGKLSKSPFMLSDLEGLEKQGKVKIVREELKANGSYLLALYEKSEEGGEEGGEGGEEEEKDDDETYDMDKCQAWRPVSPTGYLLTRDGRLIDVFVDDEEKKVILFIPPES